MADMDLSVIEGIEGSEFNCGVSPVLAKLRFQVDTLRGVLFAIDRYADFANFTNVFTIPNTNLYSFCNSVDSGGGGGEILWERQVN